MEKMALTAVRLAKERTPIMIERTTMDQTAMMGVLVVLFILPSRPRSGKAPSREKAKTVRELAWRAVCTVKAATRLYPLSATQCPVSYLSTYQTKDQRTMAPARPMRRYMMPRKALPLGPGSSATSPAQTQRTMLRSHPIA
jgi:hypothetical protein